ncbi:hypothetical protein PR202_gb10184 [Eleusine coracana subsp. coracana]|uniref:CBS domain-containing protein n=1 Tax=Eleusine coracana subsp. coracana TaxID=191504 RepID=A0AAV5EGX0_ELECO|nr:hypothetical protein PR202_gb10184 [Eleusine coracana subsp. coracana]
MFSHGADSARDVSVSAGGPAVPTRFVWPYGGKRVFLSGSFTRLPYLVIDVQYKFFVDGEWRHDERLPTATGDYGVVNTLHLKRDINQLNTVLSPSAPESRANMDVDNDNFQRAVSLSDGAVQEGHQRVSEAYIQISRCRVTEYLSLHTGYDLLPDSGKVIALDINLPVKQSFHILHEQGIPVAPLWDSFRGQFVGLLSPVDFILILRELETHGSNLTEEQLETHTISAWKEAKRQTYGSQWRPHQHLVHATPYESLRDIALKILQNEISTVPIIYSSSSDGSFPQLLHLASLSGILKSGVSSIPIVDENDSLLDTYSRSDITALAKDKVYTHVRLDEMTVHQALQLGQDANTPFGFFNGQRCQMCLRSDPLIKVMERLANPGMYKCDQRLSA